MEPTCSQGEEEGGGSFSAENLLPAGARLHERHPPSFSQRSKIGTSYFGVFQTGGNPSVSTIAMIFPFSSNSVRSRSLTLKLLFRRMALPPSFLHYFFLESRYTDDDDDDDRSFLSFQSTIKRKTE